MEIIIITPSMAPTGKTYVFTAMRTNTAEGYLGNIWMRKVDGFCFPDYVRNLKPQKLSHPPTLGEFSMRVDFRQKLWAQ